MRVLAFLTMLALAILVSISPFVWRDAPVHASWVPPPGQQLLASLTGANFNSTSDQLMQVVGTSPGGSLPRYVIRRITVTNASTSLTTAAGGIYVSASKAGTPVVLAAQVYTSLTSSTNFLDLTLNTPYTTGVGQAGQFYLSLTVPQGSAATADVYVFGDRLL